MSPQLSPRHVRNNAYATEISVVVVSQELAGTEMHTLAPMLE